MVRTVEMWPEVKEGWGITQDPITKLLYVSEGSEKVFVVDPKTLEVIKSFPVVNGKGAKIRGVNEMQWIDGNIWANIFQTDYIVHFSPEDGYITKAINLKALHEAEMDLVNEQYSE